MTEPTEEHRKLARGLMAGRIYSELRQVEENCIAQAIADAEERVEISAAKLLVNAEMLRDICRKERDTLQERLDQWRQREMELGGMGELESSYELLRKTYLRHMDQRTEEKQELRRVTAERDEALAWRKRWEPVIDALRKNYECPCDDWRHEQILINTMWNAFLIADEDK